MLPRQELALPSASAALATPVDRASFGDTPATTVLRAMLLFVPGLFCFLRQNVTDPDLWWHLKAGQWIASHHACPATDPFSLHGTGQPWTAYSWLPEVVLYGLYRAFGLSGIVLFTAAFAVAIMVALYVMLRRLQPDTPLAGPLAFAGMFGMIPMLSPRPWLVTILLGIVEIDILLAAGRTGSRRLLLWLVPLFCLWANSHIQFLVGLVILGAAVVEPLAARCFTAARADDTWRPIPFGWMLLVFALSAAATLVNPYHYQLYEAAAELIRQAGRLDSLIEELFPMSFRNGSNWVTLATVLAALFALGRRPKVRPLLPMLLALAIYLGFRSQRDAWLVLVAGLATLAYLLPRKIAAPSVSHVRRTWSVAAIVVLLLANGTLWLDEATLGVKVAGEFPAEAARFLHRAHRAGPIFNNFGWGGYLIWSLPELPVSMDGRTMIYGEDRVLRHAATMGGRADWRDDPDLAAARVLLLPASAPLASLARLDPEFRLIFQDPLAVVFERKGPLECGD